MRLSLRATQVHALPATYSGGGYESQSVRVKAATAAAERRRRHDQQFNKECRTQQTISSNRLRNSMRRRTLQPLDLGPHFLLLLPERLLQLRAHRGNLRVHPLRNQRLGVGAQPLLQHG